MFSKPVIKILVLVVVGGKNDNKALIIFPKYTA